MSPLLYVTIRKGIKTQPGESLDQARISQNSRRTAISISGFIQSRLGC